MIHFHNGDIVASLARRAGIAGRHVPFHESMVGGQVPASMPRHQWVEVRAAFLAEAHGHNLLRVRNELLEQEALIDAAGDDEEIVLWFEHDLYCTVHLLYLLVRLKRAHRLSLVWCPKALGLQTVEEIFQLYHSRAEVSPAMSQAGAEVWSAYTAEDPTALNRFLTADRSEFPFLRQAMQLHASRFPSVRNGLGEVERRAMEGIETGAADFVTLFGRFDADPPRFGFGDSEFLRHLRHLAECAVPMITMIGEPPQKTLFTVTPAGRNVLEGKVDFLALNGSGAGFWLGGAHLTRERMWRWDGDTRQIVASPPASS